MPWDHRYRRLEEGETILATDEIQLADGEWGSPHLTVGMKAPDPNYTSHRLYRRAITPEAIWESMIRAEAEAIADRENEASGHCGPYGTETWLDYEKDVRAGFEQIGKAYIALNQYMGRRYEH